MTTAAGGVDAVVVVVVAVVVVDDHVADCDRVVAGFYQFLEQAVAF